jgi:hypothetical protein
MKGKDFYLFIVTLIISFVMGLFIISNCYDQYADLITFLSTLIGFQITSIAILFNSKILKTLFDTKNNVYITELNQLGAYFKYSIYSELLSVILMLVLPKELQINFSIQTVIIKFLIHKNWLVFPIIISSIYCFLKISKVLFNLFILPRNE